MFRYMNNYSDGLRELYMYKVKNGDTLYFNIYTNTIFKVFNQDNEDGCQFYIDLFTNYSKYFKCKTTITSILETNCLVALKVLSEKLNKPGCKLCKEYMKSLELSSIDLYISSLIYQSFEISNYLKSKYNFKISTKHQYQIWKKIFHFQQPGYQYYHDGEYVNKISINGLYKTVDYLYIIENIKEPIKLESNISLEFTIGKELKLENLIEICKTITYLINYVTMAEFTRSFTIVDSGNKTRECPPPPKLVKIFNYEELIDIGKHDNIFTKKELSMKLGDIDIESNKNVLLINQLIIMAIWYGKSSFQNTNLSFYLSKFCGIHYYNDLFESQIESINSCDYIELKKHINNNINRAIYSKPFEYCKSNTANHQKFMDLAIQDLFDKDVLLSNKLSFSNLVEILLKFNNPSLLEYSIGILQKYQSVQDLFMNKIEFRSLIKMISSTEIFDIIYPIVKCNGIFNYVDLLNLEESPYGYNTSKDFELNLLYHFKSNYNQDYHDSISKLQNDSELLLFSTFVFDNFNDFIGKFTPTISNVSNISLLDGYSPVSDRIWLNKFIHLYSITPLDSGKYHCYGDFKILQWVFENHPNDLESGRCQPDFLNAPHAISNPLFLQYYYYSNQFELILNEKDKRNININNNLKYYYKLLYKEEYIISSIIERGNLKDLQTLISKLSYMDDNENSIIDSSRPSIKKLIKKLIIEKIVKSNTVELFKYMFNQYNSYFKLKYLKKLLNIAFNFVNLEIADFILNSNNGKNRIQLLSNPKYYGIYEIPDINKTNSPELIDVKLYLKEMYFHSKDKSK